MALEDLAIDAPRWSGSTVLYPSDACEHGKKLLEQMALTKASVSSAPRVPRTAVIYGNDEKFPVGGAKVVRTGDKVTIVGAGRDVARSHQAADALKAEGINVTVIDAYSIKPLGKDVILAAAKKTGQHRHHREDHYSEGGLGDAVAAN